MIVIYFSLFKASLLRFILYLEIYFHRKNNLNKMNKAFMN